MINPITPPTHWTESVLEAATGAKCEACDGSGVTHLMCLTCHGTGLQVLTLGLPIEQPPVGQNVYDGTWPMSARIARFGPPDKNNYLWTTPLPLPEGATAPIAEEWRWFLAADDNVLVAELKHGPGARQIRQDNVRFEPVGRELEWVAAENMPPQFAPHCRRRVRCHKVTVTQRDGRWVAECAVSVEENE